MPNRSIYVTNIDPTSESLSPEEKELLYHLFLAEEVKDKRRTEGREHKEGPKVKVWKADNTYPVRYKNTAGQNVETFVSLTTQINRRKKTYSRIVILGPGEEIPTAKVDYGVLYLKKSENGRVTIQSDGGGKPKTLTQEEWNREIRNKEGYASHLEGKKNLLHHQAEALKTRNDLTEKEIEESVEWANTEIERLTQKQETLFNLLNNNEQREISDDDENHAIVSSVTAIYGNQYVYEDFPVHEKEIGAGATKVPKVSSVKLKLKKPTELGQPGSIELTKHKPGDRKIAFKLEANEKHSGQTLKISAEDEIKTLRKYPTLAKRFNPKKRTVQRNEEGKIVAVYFRENRIPGVELETLRGKLNVDQLKEVTALTIKAVNTDQQNGITHKDIKEKNVLVDIDPISKKVKSVTIIDYGSVTEKLKGLVVGTPGYVSPEMYVHPARVDTRTDNYSLGVLLRRIWEDSVINDKARHVLENRSNHDINYASIAEYYLHVSTPKAKLSKKILDGLDPEYAENLQRVLNGLTISHPDDRMSSDEALNVLGIKGKPNAEIKAAEVKIEAAEVKAEPKIDFLLKAFNALGRIQSDYPLLYLLKEVLEQLQDYAKTLPENDKTRQFLFDCYKEITSSQYKLPHSTFPAVIIFVSEILHAEKKYQNDRLINPTAIRPFIPEEKLTKLKGMLYSLAYHKKQIWDDTFLAGMSRNEKKTVSILYVIGWRRRSEEIAGIIAAGFILTPIKNIFKLFTEFPLKIIAETVNYLRKNVERRQPSDLLGKAARAFFLYVILYPLTIATTGAWLLMRTITSPKTSMKEAIKANDSFRKKLDAFHPESFLGKTGKYIGLAACKLRLLPIFSGLCTLAGFAALAILATPAIAYVSTQMGITGAITAPGAWPVFSTMASWMTTPAMWLAGQLGITASAALLAGASVVSLLTVYALGLRAAAVEFGQRYWMTRNVAVAPGPVTTHTSPAANIDKPQMTTSKLLTQPGMAPGNKKTLSWKHERHSSDTEFTAVSSTSHSAASETKTLAPADSEKTVPRLTSKSPSPR